MSTATRDELRALVKIDEGIASRQIFVDEALYRQELEEIFGRAWLFLGRLRADDHVDHAVLAGAAPGTRHRDRPRLGSAHETCPACPRRRRGHARGRARRPRRRRDRQPDRDAQHLRQPVELLRDSAPR